MVAGGRDTEILLEEEEVEECLEKVMTVRIKVKADRDTVGENIIATIKM